MSVANQSLIFVSMKHVLVLIIENPLAGRMGQSANERVGFCELRELFWIKLVILPEISNFARNSSQYGGADAFHLRINRSR